MNHLQNFMLLHGKHFRFSKSGNLFNSLMESVVNTLLPSAFGMFLMLSMLNKSRAWVVFDLLSIAFFFAFPYTSQLNVPVKKEVKEEPKRVPRGRRKDIDKITKEPKISDVIAVENMENSIIVEGTKEEEVVKE